ncbi:uncharacterized protein LOC129289406 [Prosopis cineraria]|uniref:uncharacterized protein LOC129289406 n=1 Tax=Prosopis cineraria TaxID=364024 RepID=UPI00240FF0E3|nr:uncharacterized protein LOC129289406 [Prosopis cineraria]
MCFNKCPLFLLLLMLSSISQKPSVAEARPFSLKSHQGGSETTLASLGVVCKCCDGIGGACTSTWTDSCSNLQCSPWKYQTS